MSQKPLQAVRNRPVADLVAYKNNARTHSAEQIDQLVRSIEAFGWTSPVLADAQGIVAGHGRVLAARKLYEAGKAIKLPSGALLPAGTVPVIDCTGWDETKRRTYILADNELALRAGWNETLLGEELRALKLEGADLTLVGYSSDELEGLLIGKTAGQTDPDDVPEPPKVPVSNTGDLWLLGKHRVMCADTLDAQAWTRLMGKERAALLATDPPYGVSYSGKNDFLNAAGKGNANQTPIENDHKKPEEMAAFWAAVWVLVRPWMRPGASYYVTGPQGGDLLLLLLQSLAQNGFPLRHMLIWAKNNHVLGRCDYHYKHEPIIFGWVEGSHQFHGGHSQTSLWEIDKPHSSKLHPTMKPVELYERAINNSSVAGDVVLDPFGGSGTCVIACEHLGRQARSIELSADYTDVIVTRWELFTGLRATLEGDGRTFEEVREDRIDSSIAKGKLAEMAADPSRVVRAPKAKRKTAK